MKITHIEAKKPKDKVIIEMTDDEAAYLADYFNLMDTKSIGSSPQVRKLARDIIDLAGQW